LALISLNRTERSASTFLTLAIPFIPPTEFPNADTRQHTLKQKSFQMLVLGQSFLALVDHFKHPYPL
jgi:hypothetical protein